MKLPSLPEGEITAIEVHRANPYVELGISVVGGNETPLINIVIQEVYRDGVIARDGRLLAGDQILQVGAVVIFGLGSFREDLLDKDVILPNTLDHFSTRKEPLKHSFGHFGALLKLLVIFILTVTTFSSCSNKFFILLIDHVTTCM